MRSPEDIQVHYQDYLDRLSLGCKSNYSTFEAERTPNTQVTKDQIKDISL